MIWTVLVERAGWLRSRRYSTSPSVFLLLGYSAKVGLAPLSPGCLTPIPGPAPISAVLSGLLLNVALYALLRFKLLLAASPGALAPGP